MTKRILAISMILIATSVAWMILGATADRRTNDVDGKSREGVSLAWGAPQEQHPPSATFDMAEDHKTETVVDGKEVVTSQTSHRQISLPPEASQIEVNLDLRQRQKGLLWYSTYTVDFAGTYTFRNTDSRERTVSYTLPLPAQQTFYDDVAMELDGKPLAFSLSKTGASASATLAPDQTTKLRVAYQSHGLEKWRYALGDDVAQSRNFALRMRTNFKDIDFPANTLSPSEKHETRDGWDLRWRYKNLISGFSIGMTMPEKLQPGPLAGEISYFAPVSLLLFFFVMFIITTMRNIELHPMNYFFLAGAFFAFHLLLTYLVDHISIHLAFVICSLVSVFLVVSYLRLVVGVRFALLEAGLAQFVYLVAFSYTFLLKGATGLSVTLGCIATLFVAMQLTGRVRWRERFATLAPAR